MQAGLHIMTPKAQLEHGNPFRWDSHRRDNQHLAPASGVPVNMTAAVENPLVPRAQTAVVARGGYATEPVLHSPQAKLAGMPEVVQQNKGDLPRDNGSLARANSMFCPPPQDVWGPPPPPPLNPPPQFGPGIYAEGASSSQAIRQSPQQVMRQSAQQSTQQSAQQATGQSPQRRRQDKPDKSPRGGVIGLQLQKGWSPNNDKDTLYCAPPFDAGHNLENPVGDARQLHEQFRIRPDTWDLRSI